MSDRRREAFDRAVRGVRWFQPSSPALDDRTFLRELVAWREATADASPEQSELEGLLAEALDRPDEEGR